MSKRGIGIRDSHLRQVRIVMDLTIHVGTADGPVDPAPGITHPSSHLRAPYFETVNRIN